MRTCHGKFRGMIQAKLPAGITMQNTVRDTEQYATGFTPGLSY
jgi:hypothetical protein